MERLFILMVYCRASNFEPDAVWAHPTLPDGAVGTKEIEQFCNDTQTQFPNSVYIPEYASSDPISAIVA